MKIKTKDLDPIITHKREKIEELYHLLRSNVDEKKAYYNIHINEEDPHKSRIIANRPGIDLLATELLLKSEGLHDDWTDDSRITYEYLETGKKSVKKGNIRLSELEIIDYDIYQNPMRHNDATGFNNAFTNTFWVIFGFTVFVLALFGLVAVIQFFV